MMEGRSKVRLWVSTGLCLLVYAFSQTPLSAHSFPDHSEPRVGAAVTAPTSVRIWFDSAIEPAFSTIVVHDGAGQRVDNGDGHVGSLDWTLLEVGIPLLPAGTYRVIWSVVGQHGHRTNGDYTFTIK